MNLHVLAAIGFSLLVIGILALMGYAFYLLRWPEKG